MVVIVWLFFSFFSVYGMEDSVSHIEKNKNPKSLYLLCQEKLAQYLIENLYDKRGSKEIFECACDFHNEFLIETFFTIIQHKGQEKIPDFKNCFCWFKKLKFNSETQKKLVQYIRDHSPLITDFFNETLVQKVAKVDEIDTALIEKNPDPLVWFLIENILTQRKELKNPKPKISNITINQDANSLLSKIPSHIRIFLG